MTDDLDRLATLGLREAQRHVLVEARISFDTETMAAMRQRMTCSCGWSRINGSSHDHQHHVARQMIQTALAALELAHRTRENFELPPS